MHSILSLIKKLQEDYPVLLFEPSSNFRWLPSQKIIFYDDASHDSASLLHELSHALLEHNSYSRDIHLIKMESAAWEYAKTILAPKYQIIISNDIIQESLDTYRDWLHARSTCPRCRAIGIQRSMNQYSCLACGALWRVNNARDCALRRYRV